MDDPDPRCMLCGTVLTGDTFPTEDPRFCGRQCAAEWADGETCWLQWDPQRGVWVKLYKDNGYDDRNHGPDPRDADVGIDPNWPTTAKEL